MADEIHSVPPVPRNSMPQMTNRVKARGEQQKERNPKDEQRSGHKPKEELPHPTLESGQNFLYPDSKIDYKI
ncbi:MAG: hypothetical protein AB9917_06090 [Negativicutes bacterium]